MSQRFCVPLIAVCMLLAATGVFAPAHAEIDFSGKTIDVIVGSRPGDGTDSTARLIGDLMVGHLPGKPQMIYRNMPGGRGFIAFNHVADKVEPDGLTMFTGSINAFRPDKYRVKGARWNPLEYILLGGVAAPSSLAIGYVKDKERLLDKSRPPVLMGGVDGTRTTNFLAVWMPEYAGWNIRYVVGYKGTNEMLLAFERGEVQWTVMYNQRFITPYAEKPETFYFPIQTGVWQNGKMMPRPDMKDVPVMSDLIKHKMTGVALEAFEAWEADLQLGKWLALPPKTPDEYVTVYQAAYDKAVRDPKFDSSIKNRLDPFYSLQTGEEIMAAVKKLAGVSKEAQEYMDSLRRKVGIPVGGKK